MMPKFTVLARERCSEVTSFCGTPKISEATNDNREMYGEQRLIQKLQENQHRSPREICQLIIEEVQIHDRVTDYSDDKTLVVIKRSR